MRKNIFKAIAFVGIAASMAACDENAWNDKLDGFESSKPITEVKTIEYTLTDADYAAISSNATNVALAKDEGLSAELKALGTQHYFTDKLTAAKYAPAFLASSNFEYFTLSKGSAIKLTYNVITELPEELTKLSEAKEYIVTDADYQDAVWESADNYIDAFAPSKQPASYINKLLKANMADAQSGDYAIVTYDYASQEPVFGSVDTPDTPSDFVLSTVIGTAKVGDEITVNGVVTGICTQGIIVTDASGSILVYGGKTFDSAVYAIGDQLVFVGPVSAYNTGLQIDITKAEVDIQKQGTQAYTYPAPKVYTTDDIVAACARTADAPAEYVEFTAKAAVTNYINFIFDGTEAVQGSAYNITDDLKAQLANDETYKVRGYFTAVSGKGKYFNIVVTSVEKATAKAPVAPVPTQTMYAVYGYNGSKWSEAANVVILQPADYKSMGQNYNNLSNNLPAELLPTFLANKYPFAEADAQKYVVYKYYYADTKKTVTMCNLYTYTGSAWTMDNGVVKETAQFVRGESQWNYDPSTTINLPVTKGNETSVKYYQACVDWVFANVDKPLGSDNIKSGQYYVTSYGNNEYYSGTSAYQCNVDLRGAKAVEQYPDGYTGMTDDEIVELMKYRFAYQVMPGALSALHSDAVPVEGVDVIYTINFGVYTGSNAEYVVKYQVTAPAKFELVECTWWEAGKLSDEEAAKWEALSPIPPVK